MIGLIYLVAGHDPVWVRWVQAFIGAWMCVLVYLLTRSVFNHGILAGLVAAMYPPLIVSTAEILTETLFAFLLLAAVYLVVSKNGQWWRIAAGVTLGLALLTRPMAVFFLPFLGYWMFANGARKDLAFVVLGCVLVTTNGAVRGLPGKKGLAAGPHQDTGALSGGNSCVLVGPLMGIEMRPSSNSTSTRVRGAPPAARISAWLPMATR